MKRFVALTAVLMAMHAVWTFPNPMAAEKARLNPAALDYARQLITQGRAVNDKHGEWGKHQPSIDNENEFIRSHQWEEYSRWHLAIDESHSANTKARYKFPLGDFYNVHRCALIAIQSRARQYKYSDIERAATELLKMMEARSASVDSRSVSDAVRVRLANNLRVSHSETSTVQPSQFVRNVSINSGKSSL
jgi:hypothetical protein